MNIALCDDEPLHMSDIENYVLQRDSKVHIDVYFSGEALLKAYDEGVRYQAVFLDMEMGDKMVWKRRMPCEQSMTILKSSLSPAIRATWRIALNARHFASW